MKEIVILAFLASQIISTISPSSSNTFRPPGTVEIVDNFFYDATELRNADWKEYLEDLKENYGDSSVIYLSALPDTKVWRKPGLNMEPLENNYFSHPSYANYPVVGVTHKQAEDYCVWRTQAVKKMLIRLNHPAPPNFRYRLPTRTEWELVADAGYDKKEKKLIAKKLDKDGENARICNMRFSDDFTCYNAALSGPKPIRSYHPNKHGIYNLNGNIAEMVKESGIAVGGSYRNLYKNIVPTNKTLTYDGPEDWLGFRCVCEIIEE